MSTVRFRRLKADYDNLREFVRRQPRVRLLQAEGDPPERYQLEYQLKGLRQVDGRLVLVASHTVEILLPRTYPRMPPQCRMLTPVFHPNIAPHAICIGDHWAAGEPLWSMVARIGEMIAYQSYNTKSPLNGEAARWVEENQDKLPLDRINLLIDDPIGAPQQAAARAVPTTPAVATTPSASATASSAQEAAAPAPASRPAPAGPAPIRTAARTPGAAETIVVQCPGCAARYRVPKRDKAMRVRCKACQGLIEVPPAAGP